MQNMPPSFLKETHILMIFRYTHPVLTIIKLLIHLLYIWSIYNSSNEIVFSEKLKTIGNKEEAELIQVKT